MVGFEFVDGREAGLFDRRWIQGCNLAGKPGVTGKLHKNRGLKWNIAGRAGVMFSKTVGSQVGIEGRGD